MKNKDELGNIEHERALTTVYLNPTYEYDMLVRLQSAMRPMHRGVSTAWNSLIPTHSGYAVNTHVREKDYGTDFAQKLIDSLCLQQSALPCLLFRIDDQAFCHMALTDMSTDIFALEITQIERLARRCKGTGPKDPESYRLYVNREVINYVKGRGLLGISQDHARASLDRLLERSFKPGRIA